MLDALLSRHLLVQGTRIAAAVFLLLLLVALGATILKLCRFVVADGRERLILSAAAGFAAFQCIVRWLAEFPIVSVAGLALLLVVLSVVSTAGWRAVARDLRALRISCDGCSVAILLLLIAPLVMALAPAVSRDAMVYHLRFPEMTLRQGSWAYDAASSTSYNPAAMGTLYVPALAADASGVIAQLLHFGFFLLCLMTAAAIARRLGAASGKPAALLVASLPVAAIVAGWAWADMAYVFALAAAALALLVAAPAAALVFLGLAASIKYTALAAGFPLFIAAVAMLVRARAFRQLLLGVTLGAIVVSPWFVTNFYRTGNPIYPLGSDHPMASVNANWSRESQQTWLDVWSGYFLRPVTLDEDVGGLLFLAVAGVGLLAALWRQENRPLRLACGMALALWAVHLPLTAAMRLLLPAVVATMVVAGAALEQTERRRWAGMILIAAFAIRGGIVAAAHNAHFMNPLPAATGIESEASYVNRNVSAAALFARAAENLPSSARVLSIHEVRLFHFPRPVSASRNIDPPLIRQYVAGATNPRMVMERLRRDGFTHLLVATKPVERGAGVRLSPEEENLVNATLRACRVIDRDDTLALLEIPQEGQVQEPEIRPSP